MIRPLSPETRAAARSAVDCLVGAAPRGDVEAWFVRPQRCLGGWRPRDLLLAGRGEFVLHAARRTAQASPVTPAQVAALASTTWVEAGTRAVLLGDSGTGKTHLLIGAGVAAAEAGLRVGYVTCAALVNELVEAADDRVLSRVVGRYGRLDLLCVDLCRPRNYADAVAPADAKGAENAGS